MKILLTTFIISIISVNANAYYNQDNSNYHKNFMEQLKRESDQRLRDTNNAHRYERGLNNYNNYYKNY